MEFFKRHSDCIVVSAAGLRVDVSKALADGRGIIVEIPIIKNRVNLMEKLVK